MKPHTFAIMAAFALLFCGVTTHAADAPAPLKGFDAFRFVKARNIFDPDRRGMPSAQSARPSAPLRANFINVTGTMVAEGKMLAFFSGSRSEYSKVISVGDSIADFKITGITNTHVELDHSGKKVTVAVGKPIPLEGSSAAIAPAGPADSEASAPAPDGPGPDAPAASTSAPNDSKPAAAPSDDKNEVLRRMMERRAKEMSK
jgi:hypothetical protein